METIKALLSGLADMVSLQGQYTGALGVVSLVFIIVMALLFLLELFFYYKKHPRGLSVIILILGILGTFSSLYVALFSPQEGQTVGVQVLNASLVGICGGVFAVLLSLCETLYYSHIDSARSVERSVKELGRSIHEHTLDLHQVLAHQQSKKNSIGKSEVQHISQQIYDLTHHLKQEFAESRKQADEHMAQWLSQSVKPSSALSDSEHKPSPSVVLGPKVMAKTSLNSQASANQDS